MSVQEEFLSTFCPLPEDLTLPPGLLELYEIETCLAHKKRGGVWRLRRRSDGALFALKLAPVGEEDLKGEYEILTRLATVLPEAVPAPEAYYLVGEMGCLLRSYLAGETLETYRERGGDCSEQMCIRLGCQVCALLETLHS